MNTIPEKWIRTQAGDLADADADLLVRCVEAWLTTDETCAPSGRLAGPVFVVAQALEALDLHKRGASVDNLAAFEGKGAQVDTYA